MDAAFVPFSTAPLAIFRRLEIRPDLLCPKLAPTLAPIKRPNLLTSCCSSPLAPSPPPVLENAFSLVSNAGLTDSFKEALDEATGLDLVWAVAMTSRRRDVMDKKEVRKEHDRRVAVTLWSRAELVEAQALSLSWCGMVWCSLAWSGVELGGVVSNRVSRRGVARCVVLSRIAPRRAFPCRVSQRPQTL